MTALDFQMQLWRAATDFWVRSFEMQVATMRQMNAASALWLGRTRQVADTVAASAGEVAESVAEARQDASAAREAAAEEAAAATARMSEAAAEMASAGKNGKEEETADDIADQVEKNGDDPLDAAAKAGAGMPSGTGTGQTGRKSAAKEKIDRNRK